MQKNKAKHPRLKSGFGTIKYLGEGRSNPYAVYPPEYKISQNGYRFHTNALCYVPDWYTGFAILVSYKAGTYQKGDEVTIASAIEHSPEQDLCYAAKMILADYAKVGTKLHIVDSGSNKHKWIDVYQEYMEYRFGEYAAKRYSVRTKRAYSNAGSQWADLHDCFPPCSSQRIGSGKICPL